jgi:uncharacterized protein
VGGGGDAAFHVVRRVDEHRFVTELDGQLAELVYVEGDGRLTLVHDGVPAALEGRGIGSALVRAAVNRAAELDLTLVPRCPFARHWLRDHPDEASRVRIEWGPRSST